MKIPAPNHSCAHYLSWIRPHLEGIISSKSNFAMTSQKEELARSTLVIYEDIETIINNYALLKNSPDH